MALTANAIDLCLASTVAGDLGAEPSDAVQRAVTAASQAIAKYCGRVLERATVTEYPAAHGRPFLMLMRPPLVSVTSITAMGTLIAATEYEVAEADAGIVYRKGGASWPVTGRDAGLVTSSPRYRQGESGDGGITAIYVGGYVTPGQNFTDPTTYPTVTAPADLQEAAIIVACSFFRKRGVDPNIASETLGDWSVSYQGTNTLIGRGGAIPETAQAMLAPYKLTRAI